MDNHCIIQSMPTISSLSPEPQMHTVDKHVTVMSIPKIVNPLSL
jgi:hypothetical protein